MIKRKEIALAVGAATLIAGCANPWYAAHQKPEPIFSIRDNSTAAEREYLAGRAHQDQYREDLAEQSFLRVLAIDPGHVEAHNSLGTVYFMQGRVADAEAQFKIALAAAPERAHLHNNLGYLYKQTGRHELAAAEFRTAIRLEPANLRFRNNLAALTCSAPADCAEPALAETATAAQSVQHEPALAPTPAPTLQLTQVAPNVWELRAPAPPHPGAASVAQDAPSAVAAVAQAAAQPASALDNVRIEVVNGNGVPGLAKRVGAYLRKQGLRAPRLTNLLPFNQRVTVIQYTPGAEALARQVIDSLEQPGNAVAATKSSHISRVRLVLGKDFKESQWIAKGAQPDGNLVALASKSK